MYEYICLIILILKRIYINNYLLLFLMAIFLYDEEKFRSNDLFGTFR